MPTQRETAVLNRVTEGLIGGIVYVAWAGLTVALLWLVGSCGANIPWPDEWQMVPVLVGRAPVTLSWLLSRHNEHCVPICRLILIGLARLTGCDFRAGMVASVFILSLAALVLIRAVSRQRGRPSLSDIFLPLLLLHFGHRENILQGWNLQNALFCGLAIAALILIVKSRTGISPTGSISAGVLLLLLSFTGAAGIVITVPLASWLFCASLIAYCGPSSTHPGHQVIAIVMALGSLAICRVLLGFDFKPLSPALPWIFMMSACACWIRRRAAPAFALVACALSLAAAGASMWLLTFDEAPLVTLALLLAGWAGYRGIARFRSSEKHGALDGILIVGLAVAACIAILLFRRLDSETTPMLLACLALGVMATSLTHLKSRTGRLGFVLAILALLLITLGPSRSSAPPSPGMWPSLRGAIMFLSTAFGLTGGRHWPVSGFIVAFLWLVSPCLFIVRFRQGGVILSSGLLAFWLAFTGLALAVGWGRSGISPTQCLGDRYALSSLPCLCAVYVVAGMYLPARMGIMSQWFLAVLLLFWSPLNYRQGLSEARTGHDWGVRFLADVEAGKPLPYLMHRHKWLIPCWNIRYIDAGNYAVMATGLGLLREAAIGPFTNLRLNLPDFSQERIYRAHYIPAGPTTIAKRMVNDPSGLTIELDQPRHVLAILARCEDPADSRFSEQVHAEFSWRHGPAVDDSVDLDSHPNDRMAAAWVDQTTDFVHIALFSASNRMRMTRVDLLMAGPAAPTSLRIDNPFDKNPFYQLQWLFLQQVGDR